MHTITLSTPQKRKVKAKEIKDTRPKTVKKVSEMEDPAYVASLPAKARKFFSAMYKIKKNGGL